MTYRVSKGLIPQLAPIVVVGCGGTGGFVAEGLCRLLIDQPERPIVLVDHDVVERHNIGRQNFYPGDVGRYKSEVLARRLAERFEREVVYSIYPFGGRYDSAPYNGLAFSFGARSFGMSSPGVIIGCVDNARARKDIERAIGDGERHSMGCWWIDSGNDENWGQVLIGNRVESPQGWRPAFQRGKGGIEHANYLPAPTIQQPGLLIPGPLKIVAPDCAEEIIAGDQNPTINQFMAALVLETFRSLLAGELRWMSIYVDLPTGTMRTVDATPENAARVWGVKSKPLIGKSMKAIV